MVYEVVIVGGGTGGVRAAKILSRWGRDVHITVIDKNHYHIFYSALYEVSTAILPESFSHMPINFFDLKSTAAINFDDIFLDDLNITFLQDEVLGIDFNKREVKLKSSKTNKNYDYLILGIGSETNYFNNTGLLAHSFSLKTVDDALNVRNAIDEAFAKLPKNQIIKVVVGGGGFTGCEFAGEVVGYLKKLSKIHGRPEFYAECLVVEGSSVLLGGAGDYVQKRARGRLEKLGVKIKFNSMIKTVENHNLILKDESKIPFDVLVWTAGVKSASFQENPEGVETEKNRCLKVNEYLQVKPYENVFGIGDMANYTDKKSGKALPMTASVAIREAKCAAKNIMRSICKKPLVNFKPHHAGFIVPLGGRFALVETNGFCVSGHIAWLIKQMVALHYFQTLLGFRRAYRLWQKGLQIFAKND